MAKTYDFRIVLHEASFEHGSQAIHFGGTKTIVHEECVNMTLADGLKHMRELSAQHSDKPHAACIGMKYRDDRKPAGYNAAANRPLFNNPDNVLASTSKHGDAARAALATTGAS